MYQRLTTYEFIEKCKEVHGDFYDYSLVDFKGVNKKVMIICPVHGKFEQEAYSHMTRKRRCDECRKDENLKEATEKFLKEAKEIYGDIYDYSLVENVKVKEKVKILCKEHGEFEQVAYSHLKGHGCKKCRFESLRNTQEGFIKKAKKVYNDKYDYSLVEYKGGKEKVDIICPKHGVFTKTPSQHLRGRECNGCSPAKIKSVERHRNKFLKKSEKVHGYKYDYSKVEYIDVVSEVEIICENHGSFLQKPKIHMEGSGCQECGKESNSYSYTNWQKAGKSSNIFDSFKCYIIRCWNDEEGFYKIGKTFQKIKRRFRNNKSKSLPYNYEIVKIFEGEAREISELENKLQCANKGNNYIPKTYFKGHTECFSTIDFI